MTSDRLLIIDDENGFANFARRVGEGCGFQSIVTDDPEVFRAKAKLWQPSVIMLDLQMPRVDGIELLRDLAASKCNASILIASGVDTRLLECVARLAGDHGLKLAGTVQKPVRAAELKLIFERFQEADRPLKASALAAAIKSDSLLLEYQPKLDVASRQIKGVEALVRWKHPARGIVPPDQFIRLAEENGLIDALTAWVTETALRDCGEWRRQGIDLDVAINISAHNLNDMELPDAILSRCREFDVPPEAITLEVTETAAMGDPVKTMDVLTRFRLKHFQLSIDDFGTGYSSLAQLQSMPFSEIKIDKSFVMQMQQSKDCQVVVEIVIDLARKLGLQCVAEGVENDVILSRLDQLRCKAAQGYGICRPIPAGRMRDFIRSRVQPVARLAA